MRIGSYVRHYPTTSKGTKKHVKKTSKIPESAAELEIKNINFEDPISTPPKRPTTPKEVIFKRDEILQTTPPTTATKIVRKKSPVKSTCVSKATSPTASCHRISKHENSCDCQSRHHSEQSPSKKISSGVIKQRLSRHSSAILREALLSLNSDHCHRSPTNLKYEHSSRCKLLAEKRSAKWAEKQLAKEAANKSGEKTAATEVKITGKKTAKQTVTMEDKEKDDAKNTTAGNTTPDSTIISKHFVAPDLFKDSSHDFLGKDDNEMIDVIEEEEELEEKKEAEDGKTLPKMNANSSPDIVHRRIPESSSYYFIKALLNDTGEYRVSLARSDTFPQQYLMDTKVEPLEKPNSQAQSIDSDRRKSKERKESDLERRKSKGSTKNDPDRRKSGESSKSDAERKKSRESRKSDADRRKSRESSASGPDRRKSGESSKIEPEKGRSRENSKSKSDRRISGESSKSETERRKSKAGMSDSQKLDVLTYKIGRRSVIYWVPKYEVKIEIFDKNPLTDESGYLKVFRVEHDPITPGLGIKRLSMEKEESRKAPVEENRRASVAESRKTSVEENRRASVAESRKTSVEESRKASVAESKKGSLDSGRKGSSEGNRKPSSESRRLSVIEPRKPSTEKTKSNSNSIETTEELLKPLEARASVWQSSKLEMVKELNEIPKTSIATEPLITFHTSSSTKSEKSGKKNNACSKMACLKLFQTKKSKQGIKIPEIIITQPEEENVVASRRASTSSKRLESNPLKESGREISKIPRDSSPEDVRKNKNSKHSLSLRIFGGKKKAQKDESNESTASKRAEKYSSGPSYTVQHCSIRMTSMIIPMITEPTLYDFSARLLKPKTPKLKFSLMNEADKFLQKMEGGEDKLIHKKITQMEQPWHYDFQYTIKKNIRPESCPTYHSQRTVVQQIVWPNGKIKKENRIEEEKTIKKLKKKPLKHKRRKVSSAGAEGPKKLSEIVVKRVVGIQVNISEYYPKFDLLGVIIMGQQKVLQNIKREKWKLCKFLVKIGGAMILNKVKYESIIAECKRLKICQKMMFEDIPQATCTAHVVSPLRLIEVQRLRFEHVFIRPNYTVDCFVEWLNFGIFDRQLYLNDRAQMEAMRTPSWISLNPQNEFPKRRKKSKSVLEKKSSQEVNVKRKSSCKKSKQPPIEEVETVQATIPTNCQQETNDVKPNDSNQENSDRDIPITSSEMSVVTKKPDFSTCPDCGGKFSPIFQEEETTPRITIKKTNAVGSAFTKSLDSIVLNLTQAMKASKYWDNNQRKNEIDNKNLISKKSSVMINVVDYLESQISFPDRTIIQTDDDKIISIYKFEEEKHKSDVVQIFINKPKLNAISKVREKSSVWIKFHESKVATTTEIYNAALPYVKTIFEDVTRLKGFIIPLEFFEISQGIAEIKEIKYEMYLIIHPRQNAEIRVKDLEAISEEFEEAESNYQTFTSDDNDTDENLEFFDAVDFRPNDPEIICSNIIANLKDYKNNSLKYALTLLEDLVKENQKHRGKKLINPKKIKESLHELHDAFGLYEKRSEMDLQTPERGEGKDVKCFSDILKVLESVTNLVKLQLKEKRMEKESFLDYQSAVSVIKGEDFEIQPKKLKEEMMETFGLLKAYSEKAKRLIKEFKARPKENEAMKESVDCYCQKKCESFNGYFKENVENIEF